MCWTPPPLNSSLVLTRWNAMCDTRARVLAARVLGERHPVMAAYCSQLGTLYRVRQLVLSPSLRVRVVALTWLPPVIVLPGLRLLGSSSADARACAGALGL